MTGLEPVAATSQNFALDIALKTCNAVVLLRFSASSYNKILTVVKSFNLPKLRILLFDEADKCSKATVFQVLSATHYAKGGDRRRDRFEFCYTKVMKKNSVYR